jgi:hypothetical protein
MLNLFARPRPPADVPDVVIVRPRISVALGILFGSLAIVCALVPVLLIVGFAMSGGKEGTSEDPKGILIVVSVLLWLASFMLFGMSRRHLSGDQKGGRFASPRTLRIASIPFAAPLVVMIASNHYRHYSMDSFVLAAVYFAMFSYLQQLAWKRERTKN